MYMCIYIYIYMCVYHSWNMLELYQYLSPRRPIILYVLLSFTINHCGKTPLIIPTVVYESEIMHKTIHKGQPWRLSSPSDLARPDSNLAWEGASAIDEFTVKKPLAFTISSEESYGWRTFSKSRRWGEWNACFKDNGGMRANYYIIYIYTHHKTLQQIVCVGICWNVQLPIWWGDWSLPHYQMDCPLPSTSAPFPTLSSARRFPDRASAVAQNGSNLGNKSRPTGTICGFLH